jgi:electron transfer flavoprotein alpha subunit
MAAGVVVCGWSERGGGSATAEEALTLGRRLARQFGADLIWLVLGDLPADAARIGAGHGVARIDHIRDASPNGFSADRTVAALARAFADTPPDVLLLIQSDEARVVAARLAARLDAGVVMNAVDAAVADDGSVEVTATAYGGDVRAVYAADPSRPCIIALTAGAVSPEPSAEGGAEPPVRDVALDLGDAEERITVVQPATASGPRLEDARVVVAGGRGLGAAENFHLVERLAVALGGLPAASRAIVDDGWADATRQVGLTGKVTKPDLYIAAGISGASQHMAGCSSSKVIVGINRDPNAAIFRYARYGIVGDCPTVLRDLIDAVGGA